MKDDHLKSNTESLSSLSIDPDVLAKELAAEIQGDPLDELDFAIGDGDQSNISSECDDGLKWLQQGHEERLQGLRIFCEHRDKRALPYLVPLLSEPCPVERMSAVYALGRNPFPKIVNILLHLLQNDCNAYVRKAAAWSLGNYPSDPVMQPLLNALQNDIAAVRLWAASSLAEIGSDSVQNANIVVSHLLISLSIDQEPLVRSNCIWSLGRLYEKLSESLKNRLITQLLRSLMNDSEPSVRDEARISLEQLDDPKVRIQIKNLDESGLLL